ncbi:MAG: ATP-binding protein [Ilumatobacteraceae bacterium]
MRRNTELQVGASELVGREAELARVLSHFKEAERGVGAVVVVRGNGGIGKSRLVAEVARRATAMGAITVSAHAASFDRGLPYALLGELIGGLPDDLSDEATARRVALASMLGLGGPDTQPAVGGPSDVLSAAAGLIACIAEHRPLVAIWEDLHEADADSVLLFMRLSRWLAGSRVLLIGTVRSPGSPETHELEGLVDKLEVEGRGAVVDIVQLDRSEIRALVADLIGLEPDEALVDLVFSSSRGNPFFATENTRSLLTSSSIAVDSTRARLLDDGNLLHHRTAIVHRFFHVGSVEAKVGRVLSAFGRISLRHLSLVAAIADIPEARVVTAFDLLVASQLIVRRADGRFEFAHSILREALYDDLGPAEQRRIHGMIAERLANDADRGVQVDITELATHLSESAEPGDLQAIDVLVQAGRLTARTAPLVSARWFSKAASWQPADAPAQAELVALEADAMFRASRPKRAAELGTVALRQLPSGPLRTRTLAQTVNSLYIGGELQAAVDVIDAEERMYGALPVSLRSQRAHFQAQLGQGDPLEPMWSLQAEGVATVELSIAMSHDLHRANAMDNTVTRAALVEGLEALIPRSSLQTQFAIRGTMALASCLGDSRQLAEAVSIAERLRPGGNGLSIGGQLESATVLLRYLQGRWDEALAAVPELAWDFAQYDARICEGLVQFVECEIHLERGQYRRAEAIAQAFRPHIEVIRRVTDSSAGRVALLLGDVKGARRMLEHAWSRVEATGMSGSVDLLLVALIDACVADGDADAARRHLATLARGPAVDEWPLFRLREGLARAGLLGDLDAARDARVFADSLDLPFYGARARLLAAELGDDVAEHLAAAYRVFDDLGALPWRQRAAAQMRAAGLAVPRVVTDAGSGLSETESRLARMVSEGMTNNDIAAVLNYSVKTIEVYLTRLYAKTKCRSRLELGLAVTRGELELAPQT